MNAKLQDFVQQYRHGFAAYLHDRDERALSRAYELGRSAVSSDLSVLDLAVAHQDVLLGHVGSESEATAVAELLRAAGDFFLEAVSAFEMVSRALQDARETALLERRHAAILRRLSTFLTDASLALDASGSLEEMLQLVTEHGRELTGAELCAARLIVDSDTAPPLHAVAVDEPDPALEGQIEELAALYRALNPPTGSLRMTAAGLDRHRAGRALNETPGGAWSPRGWVAAALTALDGRHLGLIQAFDKHDGDFSELDEAILTQLAQMTSAAVERAQLYRRMRG